MPWAIKRVTRQFKLSFVLETEAEHTGVCLGSAREPRHTKAGRKG